MFIHEEIGKRKLERLLQQKEAAEKEVERRRCKGEDRAEAHASAKEAQRPASDGDGISTIPSDDNPTHRSNQEDLRPGPPPTFNDALANITGSPDDDHVSSSPIAIPSPSPDDPGEIKNNEGISAPPDAKPSSGEDTKAQTVRNEPPNIPASPLLARASDGEEETGGIATQTGHKSDSMDAGNEGKRNAEDQEGGQGGLAGNAPCGGSCSDMAPQRKYPEQEKEEMPRSSEEVLEEVLEEWVTARMSEELTVQVSSMGVRASTELYQKKHTQLLPGEKDMMNRLQKAVKEHGSYDYNDLNALTEWMTHDLVKDKPGVVTVIVGVRHMFNAERRDGHCGMGKGAVERCLRQAGWQVGVTEFTRGKEQRHACDAPHGESERLGLMDEIVETIVQAIREATLSGATAVLYVFVCKSGQDRSVAVTEVTASLVHDTLDITTIVTHLNTRTWRKSDDCNAVAQRSYAVPCGQCRHYVEKEIDKSISKFWGYELRNKNAVADTSWMSTISEDNLRVMKTRANEEYLQPKNVRKAIAGLHSKSEGGLIKDMVKGLRKGALAEIQGARRPDLELTRRGAKEWTFRSACMQPRSGESRLRALLVGNPKSEIVVGTQVKTQ